MKVKILFLTICYAVLFPIPELLAHRRANIAATTTDDGSSVGEIQLYISPKGSDANPGTKKAPLRSMVGARDKVRELRRDHRDQSVTVYVGGGLYQLDHPILFSAEDSGSETAKVVYQAVEGQEPVFLGSKKLKKWKVLKDKAALLKLDPAVAGKVFVTDLASIGITDYGDPTHLGMRPELFCNNQVQTLARWPNEGFTTAGKVRGKTALPETYVAKIGTKEGAFEFLEKRQNRWAKEGDPRLGGYWYWDWSEEFQQVASIDTLTQSIHIKEPYHRYGYKDSLRYFGLNLFCEIDTPGEWYLDRTSGLLYWYPPTGVDPSKAQVSLSVFSSPFMVEVQDCKNFTLHGLAFEEGRGSAIRMQHCENSLIADCRIERFGRDGIHLLEGKGNGISSCLLRTLGCGGIRMKGGNRKMLLAGEHFVTHTIIENFSLFKKTYEPAVYAAGCGLRMSHNRFRFSSSSAFRLEGNDMVVEYNQISHVVNESDDQGGMDVFFNPSFRGNVVKYNHWANIAGGTRHGAAGVRLDDMICGFTIYGNIFEKCGTRDFAGVQIHGGKENLVENNLFYKCPAAVSFSTWGEKRWLEMLDSPAVKKKLYEEVDIHSELYQSRYPALKRIQENPDVNTVINNLLVDCEKVLMRDKSLQIQDNNTTINSEGKGLSTFYNGSYLESIGLMPIPFAAMGPQSNRWARE
ncbi:parallel beta helix pectate lyase-like protein [Dyadobacter jejuensis]|uniref:Parallel beta helix pectate lyase-like protein n=1 Tax=Dyadobacter jejuensis TaxID=1082580 RepID=A0A316ANR5_9BACT|nr:right-handed parallel beta-helix repeat-containing protein [Dyadobacter jejuensis]PWJ58430.1 parallel beta helix pectate lyase-like protein [Dyadobacter jejuensis]